VISSYVITTVCSCYVFIIIQLAYVSCVKVVCRIAIVWKRSQRCFYYDDDLIGGLA